jgi:hypothetical protein
MQLQALASLLKPWEYLVACDQARVSCTGARELHRRGSHAPGARGQRAQHDMLGHNDFTIRTAWGAAAEQWSAPRVMCWSCTRAGPARGRRARQRRAPLLHCTLLCHRAYLHLGAPSTRRTFGALVRPRSSSSSRKARSSSAGGAHPRAWWLVGPAAVALLKTGHPNCVAPATCL